MKKIAMCLVGAMTVLSLAACTPTAPKETKAQPIETAETKDGRAEKVPDPNAPELDLVSIYSGNDDATGLVVNMEGIEELDAQHIVDLLATAGVLEEGTVVNSFEVEGGEKAGPGVEVTEGAGGERIGTLDLSKVPESGTAGEQVILGSIGNTFIESFELDKLKLLVNGENYSSGHIEHGDEDYLTFISDYEKFKN